MVQKDLKIYDGGCESVTSEDRVRFARECEEAALSASSRVITCAGSYLDRTSESVKVHSNGFEGEKRSTFYQAWAEATLRGDDDARIDDYEAGAGIFRSDLPSPEALGTKAVERAWRKNGQGKIASGVHDLLVENRALRRFLGALRSCMNGQQLYRKNSFLLDKLDEQVAADVFTMTDEPHLESGFSSRLYDSDGMPSRRRVLIDKGVLKSYLIGYFWSRKLNVEPTTGSTTNLLYSYGDKSLEEMAAKIDKGILVTDFIGGNYNATTGEFSYGIIGEYIENGKVVQPVNEMNVSGKYQDLWMNLFALGNDPYRLSADRCPSLWFKEVQFAGA
jgi:PmbA protein